MNLNRVAIVVPVVVLGLAACGGEHIPPPALVAAKAEYTQAKNGIALQLDPTDVHEADLALQKAVQAWNDAPEEPNTIDLAVIAQRKAQIAEAEADALKAQQDAEAAKQELQGVIAGQLKAARGQLDQTKQALNQTKDALNNTQGQLESEKALTADQQKKLTDMEAKLKDARDTIAKIAAVKDDDRGMVITLSGEVLFKTGMWDITKAGAIAKLDQIGEALLGKEQPIVVFGYTDNVGTRDNNMELSLKRAQAVADYLVSKGIPKDLVTAQGKGPDEPISDNGSVEGRAANRRVEIVVQPKKS